MRKIVQIQVLPADAESASNRLCALCDDGSLWLWASRPPTAGNRCRRSLLPLPMRSPIRSTNPPRRAPGGQPKTTPSSRNSGTRPNWMSPVSPHRSSAARAPSCRGWSSSTSSPRAKTPVPPIACAARSRPTRHRTRASKAPGRARPLLRCAHQQPHKRLRLRRHLVPAPEQPHRRGRLGIVQLAIHQPFHLGALIGGG